MNAVEIEAAVSELVQQPFIAEEFPFAFLEAFGNKETTLTRLRKGNSNASDLPGAVLQKNNIHIAVAEPGEVSAKLKELRESPKTLAAKAKFIFATDGETIEAEELVSGEALTCDYQELPDHFGFFLPLAGITTIKEIKDNPIDVKATGRLNKLYIELLKDNEEWATEERRHDLNHFMSRLIFCFFAEDTNIFKGQTLFTKTVDQMSEKDGSNVHLVLSKIFEAMNIKIVDRKAADLPSYAGQFPYVNGGLFEGNTDVPLFSKIARSYLLRAGELNWTQINPDIFGSMIQAIADESERGSLGMHYTSVPNILKVLNPLFLDDLRKQLDDAGDNSRMLLNLRKRISRIRVFDPACGSGNFLVIAYKELRAIEDEVNRRRKEPGNKTEIPLTNFRGIEIRDFAAEVARLALIIAEYQCNVRYRGPLVALDEFLPLNKKNWIIKGNALRLNWVSLFEPKTTEVKILGDDLFGTPLEQAEIQFENEGGEIIICGNPPYLGSQLQNEDQKADLKSIFGSVEKRWPSLDYIAGWFMKAASFKGVDTVRFAFVSTNSISQGEQVPVLWPHLLKAGLSISFAHTSFKWNNLARSNAGVTVSIIGLVPEKLKSATLYHVAPDGSPVSQIVENINPYLIPYDNLIVFPLTSNLSGLPILLKGNMPTDGGNLCLSLSDKNELVRENPQAARFIRRYLGSQEFIRGQERYCIWVNDEDEEDAWEQPLLAQRFKLVSHERSTSKAKTTRPYAAFPHRFRQIQAVGKDSTIIVPRVSSESREFLPVGLLGKGCIVSDGAFAMYDAPLWNLALIASKLHLVWIGTVCGKLKTDYRYSNTLGWNTFPVPTLTENEKQQLTRCAEDILLAREAHFPATIAELYEPDKMPDDLRRAHDRNDEVLERIYIGRRFKNDTERLEKLFEMYSKMVKIQPAKVKKRPQPRAKKL